MTRPPARPPERDCTYNEPGKHTGDRGSPEYGYLIEGTKKGMVNVRLELNFHRYTGQSLARQL